MPGIADSTRKKKEKKNADDACLIGWSALGAVRGGERRDGKQRRP
jgi:hypothetical protein